MNRVTEITDLFSKLASKLQSFRLTSDEGDLNSAITFFNQSLNLNERSRVRVLDTALSLMCFKAPQVFNSEIEYLVKTIVAVLSSSISCKVLPFQREEFLQIGSSISTHDCVELIERCTDILKRLEEHGRLSKLLLCAVLRVAISTSSYQSMFPLTIFLNVKLIDGRYAAVSKLHCLLPKEISIKNHEIPLRLLLWYLDPMTLKDDISKILQDTMERPFICLKKEMHERMDWRSIIICLVLSPTMFIEARALLHKWFLLTGSEIILELQIELISSILDILSRPMQWGISADVGSKLPFSHAYSPHMYDLLATLAGPLSCDGFLHLVHIISQPDSCGRRHSDQTAKRTAVKAGMIDHISIWATVMSFPGWFFFAAVLLFSGTNCLDNFSSTCTSGTIKTDQTLDVDQYRAASARYLAWILSPISEVYLDILVDCLIHIAGSWMLKPCALDTYNKDAAGCRKKLKKPKSHDSKRDQTPPKKYDCRTVKLWLKEFHNRYMRCWNKSFNSSSTEAKTSHNLALQQNILFRRIPLGILIGSAKYLDEEGCELLLHYAATGAILHSSKPQDDGMKHTTQKSERHDDHEHFTMGTEVREKRKESQAGACLIFKLFDVIEDMAISIFETEESGLDFVLQVKVKVVNFLGKCIKELLILKIDEDEGGVMMLMDLRRRLVLWQDKGQEVFQGQGVLDDVIHVLNCKLSSYEKI